MDRAERKRLDRLREATLEAQKETKRLKPLKPVKRDSDGLLPWLSNVPRVRQRVERGRFHSYKL